MVVGGHLKTQKLYRQGKSKQDNLKGGWMGPRASQVIQSVDHQPTA